jgi:23S rRNA (cytosine1962-C5)-methyltransferase
MRADEKRCRSIVETAEAKRREEIGARSIDAYRVVRGSADGAPTELAIDRYLDFIVVTHRDSLPHEVVEVWCEAASTVLAPKAIVLKTMAKRVEESTSRVIFGSVPDAPIAVREEDAVFLCDLNDGVQTGLFLDHQETRFESRRYAAGAEVLNLFAYTCAFSVHAALAGAARVTSVDASKRALDRGRANMEQSGIDPDRHRWFTDDVLDHLSRKRGPDYGLIILDPPVFGRSKKRTFSLSRDLDRLIEGAVARLASEGVLIFSTHATQLSLEGVRRRLPGTVLAAREADHLKTVIVSRSTCLRRGS